MDCFKHGILLSDIGTSSSSNTSLEFSSFVSKDISIKVREDDNPELGPALGIHKLSGHDIDVPIVAFDLRIFFSNLIADIQKFSIRRFNHIGLCYESNSVNFIFLGIIKSQTDNSLCALSSDNFKVKGYIISDIDSFTPQDISAFCVFSEKHPVYSFFRD